MQKYRQGSETLMRPENKTMQWVYILSHQPSSPCGELNSNQPLVPFHHIILNECLNPYAIDLQYQINI